MRPHPQLGVSLAVVDVEVRVFGLRLQQEGSHPERHGRHESRVHTHHTAPKHNKDQSSSRPRSVSEHRSWFRRIYRRDRTKKKRGEICRFSSTTPELSCPTTAPGGSSGVCCTHGRGWTQSNCCRIQSQGRGLVIRILRSTITYHPQVMYSRR